MLGIVIVSQQGCGRLSIYSRELNDLNHKRYYKIVALNGSSP
jgi:hypothetical protein